MPQFSSWLWKKLPSSYLQNCPRNSSYALRSSDSFGGTRMAFFPKSLGEPWHLVPNSITHRQKQNWYICIVCTVRYYQNPTNFPFFTKFRPIWHWILISSNPYEGHNNQLVPWWKLPCGQPIGLKNLASLWTSGNEYQIIKWLCPLMCSIDLLLTR